MAGDHLRTSIELTVEVEVERPPSEVSGLQVLLRPYLKRWLRRERRASAQALKVLVEAAAGS